MLTSRIYDEAVRMLLNPLQVCWVITIKYDYLVLMHENLFCHVRTTTIPCVRMRPND
jgi:hypothetical protein